MTDTWHETISEKEKLEYKIYKLEEENKRFQEALELIKEAANNMSANGASIYDLISIRNICCDALEGWKE